MTQNLALQFGSFNFRLSSITKTRKTTKTTKKEHLFHSKNSLKKHHSFYRPEFTQHCKNYTPATHLKSLLTLQIFQQKCFWLFSEKKNISTVQLLDVQELHSLNTLKANLCIFLYISVRKCLFQRRRKFLSGGRLNNFQKVACCLGLAKCCKIFYFN